MATCEYFGSRFQFLGLCKRECGDDNEEVVDEWGNEDEPPVKRIVMKRIEAGAKQREDGEVRRRRPETHTDELPKETPNDNRDSESRQEVGK